MLVNMPYTGPMGLHSDWTLALKKPAVTVEMDQITDSVQVKNHWFLRRSFPELEQFLSSLRNTWHDQKLDIFTSELGWTRIL